MKFKNTTDNYRADVFNTMLRVAPLIGASAAATFTIARFLGCFKSVEISSLIAFDAMCVLYFVACYIMKKIGVTVNGEVSEKRIVFMDIGLAFFTVLQWNLITYIFPTRSFWGYAPMFALLTCFMFRARAVLVEICWLSISIVISWALLPDQLLPYHDGLFVENMCLRIVALVISFAVIYMLTYYAEKFTIKEKENFRNLQKQNTELETMSKDVIEFTADIIEERDSVSGMHVKRIKNYTRILAEEVAKNCPEYGLDKEKIEQIALASVLHDIGKIGIPDNILMKPGKLTEEEFEVIKTHASIGARLVDKLPDSIGEDYKHCCREVCQFHHEKYDGKGYPTGLKGDDIPISAQIVSVADCYDALSSERPYKKAYPGEVAINMILNGECGAYSDKIKKCILACKEDLLKA